METETLDQLVLEGSMEMEVETLTPLEFAIEEARISADDEEFVSVVDLGRRLKTLRLSKPTAAERHAMDCLAAHKSGLPLLDVDVALRAGGIRNGLPVLALAPPASQTVRCWRGMGGWMLDGFFMPDPDGGLVSFLRDLKGTSVVSAVPMIPPAIRPREFHKADAILFEAEWRKWIVPADPVLLRFFTPSIAGILATWDMTKAEADAVNRARRG